MTIYDTFCNCVAAASSTHLQTPNCDWLPTSNSLMISGASLFAITPADTQNNLHMSSESGQQSTKRTKPEANNTSKRQLLMDANKNKIKNSCLIQNLLPFVGNNYVLVSTCK